MAKKHTKSDPTSAPSAPSALEVITADLAEISIPRAGSPFYDKTSPVYFSGSEIMSMKGGPDRLKAVHDYRVIVRHALTVVGEGTDLSPIRIVPSESIDGHDKPYTVLWGRTRLQGAKLIAAWSRGEDLPIPALTRDESDDGKALAMFPLVSDNDRSTFEADLIAKARACPALRAEIDLSRPKNGLIAVLRENIERRDMSAAQKAEVTTAVFDEIVKTGASEVSASRATAEILRVSTQTVEAHRAASEIREKNPAYDALVRSGAVSVQNAAQDSKKLTKAEAAAKEAEAKAEAAAKEAAKAAQAALDAAEDDSPVRREAAAKAATQKRLDAEAAQRLADTARGKLSEVTKSIEERLQNATDKPERKAKSPHVKLAKVMTESVLPIRAVENEYDLGAMHALMWYLSGEAQPAFRDIVGEATAKASEKLRKELATYAADSGAAPLESLEESDSDE